MGDEYLIVFDSRLLKIWERSGVLVLILSGLLSLMMNLICFLVFVVFYDEISEFRS